MVKVLVTGGSGFIGKEIVKVLQEKGFEVHVFDQSRDTLPGVRYFQGSVLDPEAVSKAMLGCEYVLHLAAILGVSKSSYEPVECLDVNILGTRNILRCSIIHRIKKLVFPSSSEVYGEPKEIPVVEDNILQPKSEYGISKYVGEEYIKAYGRQHGLLYTIVRYFNVYGEEQRHSWVVAKFVNNALLGKPLYIFGDGEQIRAFCHVRDAARGTVQALLSERANNHVFNIGNSAEICSIKELAYQVLRAVGRTDSPTFIPMEQSDRSREREIYQRIPSIEKAKHLLDFQASITLQEGLQSMIAYKRNFQEQMCWEVEEAERYEKVVKSGKAPS